MDELLKILNDYIEERDTEYAVLISGDWGSGKTFFWKNDISTIISTLKINGEKIRPVYISLFGYNKVDEIIDNIVIQYCAPHVKKYALFSAIRNSLLKKLQIDNFKDIIHSMVNLNNVVICFDDLERTSITMKDILGYINSLVEHNNFKVVIICDENKINSEDYDKFKEKTIGVTYKFNPDYLKIISAIIDSYRTNIAFYRYLLKNKEIIQNIFNRSEKNNIRVLKHALFIFLKIFHYLFAIGPDYPQKYGTEMLIFVLVMSFELKANNPTNDKIKEIEAYANDDYPLLSMMMMERKEGVQIFDQEIHERYYYDMENYLYTSKIIYNYIKYGYFNSREFIINIFENENGEDREWDLIKKVLSRYWTMSDNEFNETTTYVLDNIVSKGKIANIFIFNKLFLTYLIFIDNDIFNSSRSELITTFKKGMNLAYSQGILKYNKSDESELYNIDKNYLQDDSYLEIDKESDKLRMKIKADWIKTKCIECFELLDSDISEFINKLNADDSDSLLYEPCFKYIDAQTLFEKITNINNDDLILFRNSIENRYKIAGSEDRNKEERNTFIILKEKLETFLKEREDCLSTHLFKVLILTLEKILNKGVPQKELGNEQIN